MRVIVVSIGVPRGRITVGLPNSMSHRANATACACATANVCGEEDETRAGPAGENVADRFERAEGDRRTGTERRRRRRTDDQDAAGLDGIGDSACR